MSSTNKTSNYNLSQFVGSDKPAWLADYNQDMSKIDAQMKLNADEATSADGKADANATNIGNLENLTTSAKTSLVAAVNEVDGTADNAYTLASNASTAASGASTKADNLEAKFNFTDASEYTVQITGNGSVSATHNKLSVAVNTDGSLCKTYGWIVINNPSNITRIYISGTPLRPTAEFTVKCAGIQRLRTVGSGEQIAGQDYQGACDLTYKTNGDIEISVPNTTNYYSQGSWNFVIPPTLTFVKSFGDTPTPQD